MITSGIKQGFEAVIVRGTASIKSANVIRKI